jgi:hypothetical protein
LLNQLPVTFDFMQGCGSGSGRIGKYLRVQIWIRILIQTWVQIKCFLQLTTK